MKKHLTLLLIITLIFQACEKDNSNSEYINNKKAKNIITDWIYNEYNPDMNPGLEFSLNEYTTNEIYSKLNGQIFSIDSDVPGLMKRWVFIKNEKVYDLHSNGGHEGNADNNNIIVTNLDNNERYELCYTSHVGSGLLWQLINCFYFVNDSTNNLHSELIAKFPIDYQIQLQKNGDQTLNVIYVDPQNETRIAEAKLSEENENKEFTIILENNIPQEITDNLNGISK